jgi:hypothetical protein
MKKVKLLGVVLGLVLCAAAFADAPPIIPSNSCQAQCLAEFRQCQALCSRVLCLVPCETLLDACLLTNCPIR